MFEIFPEPSSLIVRKENIKVLPEQALVILKNPNTNTDLYGLKRWDIIDTVQISKQKHKDNESVTA